MNLIGNSNHSMTKAEAIEAMRNGERVYHSLFSPDEYIYMKGDWIYDKDGYYCDSEIWWSYRTGEQWAKSGWEILRQK